MERMMPEIKIDLQVIMIIWGEEIQPLFSLFLCFFSSPHILSFLFVVFFFGVFLGGGRTSFSPPSESASDYCNQQMSYAILDTFIPVIFLRD